MLQRPNGSWALVIDLGRDPVTGRRKRRWITAPTKAALKRRTADETARGGGTIRPRPVGTVGEWVERWLHDEIEPNRGPGTYALYEGVWRVHAAPIVGAVDLAAFDEEHVDALYRRLREAGISANTIRRVGTVLHRAFAVAIQRRIYRLANPFGNVEKPRHIPKETRALDADEARRFLEAARTDRFEALWVLLVTAGLR
ncbi:MAG: site-specific integrase, partial [Vulcanimicrobiaceae bacterium]